MRFSASLPRCWPLVAQGGLILFGLTAVYAMPPARGRMLLVPLTHDGRIGLVPAAVAHGARLVASGPWAGSILVEGRRNDLVRPLLGRGVIAISARAGGCGEAI